MRTFFVLLISVVSSVSWGQDLTKLDSILTTCMQLSSGFSSYVQNVSTPPTLGGVISRTALADVCGELAKVQNLIYHEQNLAAKLKLLSTTSKNWQTDLLFGTAIAQIAASKFYSESQPTDIAEIENKKEDQELRDYYRQMALDGSEDLSSLEAAREKAGQIDAFGRAARRRAMLSDALACPTAAGNTNYATVYANNVQPLVHNRQTYKNKKDYYYKRLQQLGQQMAGERLDEYNKDLKMMTKNGVTIDVVDTSKTSDYKTRVSTTTGQDPTLQTTDTAVTTTQSFTANIYNTQFSNFHDKWSKAWKDFIDSGSSYGETYMNMTEQCLGNVPPKTDVTVVGDINNYGSWAKNCNSSTNQTPEKPNELTFNEVLSRYQTDLYQYANYQAQIWTQESALLQQKVVTNPEIDGTVDLENKPSCDTTPMSNVELEMNKTKMMEAESEFKEITASEKMKDAMLRDEELKQQQQDAEMTRALRLGVEKEKDNHDKSTNGLLISSPGSPGI